MPRLPTGLAGGLNRDRHWNPRPGAVPSPGAGRGWGHGPDFGFEPALIAADLGRMLAGRGARPSAIHVRVVSAIERTAAGKAPVVLAPRPSTER